MNQYTNPYPTTPYGTDPMSYISQALGQAMPTSSVQQPGMPQMTPESKNFGPAHGMLQQYFQQALQSQLGVPGLLQQMQSDPQMAQRIGGLLSSYAFTPPQVAPRRIDWGAHAAASAGDGASEPYPGADYSGRTF